MIRLLSLSASHLHLFRELMGSSDFGGCFCAVWTSYGEDWEARCGDQAQPNFDVTAERVKAGKHVGYLVYENDTLVGWTGSGPKTTFPLLETKLGSRRSDFSERIWAVGCIAIKNEFRGRSLSSAVIGAVIAEALRQGAWGIEAYPVRPFHEPRIYRGTEGLYKRAGFEEVLSEKDGDFEILLMRKNFRDDS